MHRHSEDESNERTNNGYFDLSSLSFAVEVFPLENVSVPYLTRQQWRPPFSLLLSQSPVDWRDQVDVEDREAKQMTNKKNSGNVEEEN
jgi:hypothetical protein